VAVSGRPRGSLRARLRPSGRITPRVIQQLVLQPVVLLKQPRTLVGEIGHDADDR